MRYFPALLLYCFFLFGCTKTDQDKGMGPTVSTITVRLHEKGSNISERYPGIIKEEKQPAGLNFYETDRIPGREYNVEIKIDDTSLNIANVKGLLATEDAERQSEGVKAITVTSTLTGNSGISHEEARNLLFRNFQTILKNGWTSIIPHATPRINGKHMLNFALNFGNPHGLDPTYIPTMQEWMKLENLSSWEFYKKGAYLQIAFMREENKPGSNDKGDYLIKYDVISEKDYYKEFVAPELQQNWTKHISTELDNAAKRRIEFETELRSAGIPILLEYQNPPAPQFK